MSSVWQLSWNHKNYDGERRMLTAAADERARNMTQSWGKTSTKNIAKIKVGDTIYISSKKKCIGKAVVTKAFYQSTEVEFDEFVKNNTERDERHENRWYCMLRIIEMYFGEHQKDLSGNQITFCNPTNAFWK
jgi:hypothetical protein